MPKEREAYYIQRLDDYLQRTLAQSNVPAQRIKEAIHYALFPGGKRLRALLVYYAGELFQLPEDCLDVMAAAVEITHCYSLIHDDLPAMDDDDFRRGKPSCHKAFDEATAILAGDGMQALAIELLLEQLPDFLSSQQVVKVSHTLLKATGISGMVSGQSLDLTELASKQITEKELTNIHLLKTGCLIKACIEMVLHASEANPEQQQALIDFSDALGLVFQMQDDYLDSFAAPQTLGKNRASDLANEKTTFATLYGKTELHGLIEHYFNQAEQSLSPLANRASALIFLTRELAARTLE